MVTVSAGDDGGWGRVSSLVKLPQWCGYAEVGRGMDGFVVVVGYRWPEKMTEGLFSGGGGVCHLMEAMRWDSSSPLSDLMALSFCISDSRREDIWRKYADRS